MIPNRFRNGLLEQTLDRFQNQKIDSVIFVSYPTQIDYVVLVSSNMTDEKVSQEQKADKAKC